MKEQLVKAMKRNQLIDLIYMTQDGKLTKRRVRIINIEESTFKGFCFTRNAKRTFKIENILSMLPVIRLERVSISC